MWTGLVQYKAWVPGSTRSPGEVTRREATVIPFRVGGSGQGAAAPISFPRRGGRDAVTGRPADATLPSAKTGEAPAPPPGLSGALRGSPGLSGALRGWPTRSDDLLLRVGAPGEPSERAVRRQPPVLGRPGAGP